jgi:hypothetical protein
MQSPTPKGPEKEVKIMILKRNFSPPRTFDEQLEALVKLLREKQYSHSRVDLNQCEQDVLAQRQGRAAHDDLAVKYREAHARFAEEQSARYKRFIRLLNSARAAFGDDSAMMAALKQFDRKRTRRSTDGETPPASTAA